jgi:hypothetical protein
MTTSLKNLHCNAAVHCAVVSILGATALLSGCVVRVAPPPPPPRVYVAPPPPPPPPPPAYTEPAPSADVAVQVNEAPPPLPDYEQPSCPVEGYIWTPGYWAYAGGYYWVPGTWIAPPSVGLLWTPGYWGFVGGVYAFHAGYWGPHVGFYGGVNYGFGYVGTGFVGGRWVGGAFAYNQAVTNIHLGGGGGGPPPPHRPGACSRAGAARRSDTYATAAHPAGGPQSSAVRAIERRPTGHRGDCETGRVQWSGNGERAWDCAGGIPPGGTASRGARAGGGPAAQ